MPDRVSLMEAALDVYPEGLALLDGDGRVVFWNRAAEQMTGHPGAEVVGRRLPKALEALATGRNLEMHGETRNGSQPGRGSLVHAQHKMGGDVPAIARTVVLRDDLGTRIGTAVAFHPAALFNALPHGETSEVEEVRQSRAELKDRLENEYELFLQEGVPLAVLWLSVDQAHELRRTHGARACETMLEAVERKVANGLRPGEEIGRWSDAEFLVTSHEISLEKLQDHGQMLVGLARTTDFRWWGDRISLTVSVGGATTERDEILAQLLERAEAAMRHSMHAGGNQVTVETRRQPCSPS